MPTGHYPRPSLEERVQKKIVIDDATKCWLWRGTLRPDGYGTISVRRGGKNKFMRAHRLVYEMHRGPIPLGLHLDHLCRRPCCVNPAHLEPVTNRENTLRGLAPIVNGANHKEKTHCPKGHPYSGDNLYLRPDRPGRHCRACQREADLRHKAKRRIA